MKWFVRGGRLAALSLGAGLVAASPVAANQFVGDLVYCDVDANGVYDGADYKLNGVEVRVTCSDANGLTCLDTTATTGALHPSVTPAAFDATCAPVAGYGAGGDLSGRYLVELLGVNGAVAGCLPPSDQRPYQCRVTVNEATLPESCNGLVTPVVGLPADANADGDWCDPEDGPFPEGQILGGSSRSQASCEAGKSAGPSDGVHMTFSYPAPGRDTACALYADFGYTPRPITGATRTPGFWKTHPNAVAANLPIQFCGRTVTSVCDAIGLAGQQGGGLNAFTRHAVSAALNCNAFGCSADIQSLLSEGNAACAANDASYDFGGAASVLDEFNNSGDAIESGLDQESANPRFCRAARR